MKLITGFASDSERNRSELLDLIGALQGGAGFSIHVEQGMQRPLSFLVTVSSAILWEVNDPDSPIGRLGCIHNLQESFALMVAEFAAEVRRASIHPRGDEFPDEPAPQSI
jgi:hypothetical protein